MRFRPSNGRFVASLALAGTLGLLVAAEATQAADRKVLFENFTSPT